MSVTANGPGFGAYLLAVIVPPISFFIQGKPIAGVVSFIILGIALPFVVLGVGLVPWFLMAMWALFSLKNKALNAFSQNQANLTAQAIVTAQREEAARVLQSQQS